jgi:hypothetical protein
MAISWYAFPAAKPCLGGGDATSLAAACCQTVYHIGELVTTTAAACAVAGLPGRQCCTG